MSSWSDTRADVRVLRGVTVEAADLGTVRAGIARDLVVDPRLVDDATAEGYRTGYDGGFTAGLEDAATAIDVRERARGEQLAAVVTRLAAAADELQAREVSAMHVLEDDVVRLAFGIAEELVGHELRTVDERGRDALVRALRFAPEQGLVVARLHPDDVATLGDSLAAITAGRAIEVVADASLAPGDCVVDVGACRVDGRIGAALERIAEVLAT